MEIAAAERHVRTGEWAAIYSVSPIRRSRYLFNQEATCLRYLEPHKSESRTQRHDSYELGKQPR
jgi:hypothetical protein